MLVSHEVGMWSVISRHPPTLHSPIMSWLRDIPMLVTQWKDGRPLYSTPATRSLQESVPGSNKEPYLRTCQHYLSNISTYNSRFGSPARPWNMEDINILYPPRLKYSWLSVMDRQSRTRWSVGSYYWSVQKKGRFILELLLHKTIQHF